MEMRTYNPSSLMIVLNILERLIISILVFFMVVMFLNRKLSSIIAAVVFIILLINLLLKARINIKTDDKTITIINGNETKTYELDKIKIITKSYTLCIFESDEANIWHEYDLILLGKEQYYKLIEDIYGKRKTINCE